MAVNEWWLGDPRQRFWMEITQRDDVGANLIAPQRDDGGSEYWSYSLVNHVREGDVVLHWHKPSGPALVGWSRVAGQPFASTTYWQSRGSYGRLRQSQGEEPAWVAPLTGYTPVLPAFDLATVRDTEAAVRGVRDLLESRIDGAVYFPFALSDLRPARPAQGYLVKFPFELLSLFPQLEPLLRLAHAPVDATDPDSTVDRSSGMAGAQVGRQRDAEVRAAIERHSVAVVTRWLEAEGWTNVRDVGLFKSWDLEAERGGEVLHVEVKGSAGRREAVELTDNEVRHAEDCSAALLAVVDEIHWERRDGELATTGGRLRYWDAWTPERAALMPTRFRYVLATEAAVGGLADG